MTQHQLEVRPAAEQDLEPLNDMYNQYVKDTHFTFDLEPMTIEARREWFTPADWDTVRLPDGLFFLYPLVRPVGWLVRRWRR